MEMRFSPFERAVNFSGQQKVVSDFHFGPYSGQKTSLKLNDVYFFFRVVNLFLYSLQMPLRGKVPNTDDFEVFIHTLVYDSPIILVSKTGSGTSQFCAVLILGSKT